MPEKWLYQAFLHKWDKNTKKVLTAVVDGRTMSIAFT